MCYSSSSSITGTLWLKLHCCESLDVSVLFSFLEEQRTITNDRGSMNNYGRKRPQLPDTTPFLPSTKFAVVTPWHGETVRTASAPSSSSIVQHQQHGFEDGQRVGSAGGTTFGNSLAASFSSSMTSRQMPSLVSNHKYMSPAVLSRIGTPATPGLPRVTTSSTSKMRENSVAQGSMQLILLDDNLVDSEIEKRNIETESIREQTNGLEEQRKVVERDIHDVKILLGFAEAEAAARQRNINSLASVNMMLINTMESLELQPESDEGLTDLMLRYRQSLLPDISKTKADMGKKKKARLGFNDVYTINQRLRTNLIIMSREYFKSGKEVNVAYEGYEALRQELKTVEAKNRSLQHDFDEILKDEMSNVSKQMMSKQLKQGVGFSVLEGRLNARSDEPDQMLYEFEETLRSFRKRQVGP